MEDSIKITIKQATENSFEIQVKGNGNVLDIKNECHQKSGIVPSEMKLIFKGKILKDQDSIESLNIKEGATMHMVHSKPQINPSNEQPQQQQQQQQQPQSNNSNNNNNNNNVNDIFAGLGGMGGMGGLGGLGGMGLNPQMMQGMMQDPMFGQMLNNVLSNPQMLQNIIGSNPMLSNMVNSNPQLQQALNDPAMLQAMSNPAMMQQAMSMLGGGALNQQSQQQTQAMPDFSAMMGMMGGYNPAMSNNNNSNNSNLSPQEKYKDQIKQCNDMGFNDEVKVIAALQATNGNVEAAVERLLNDM